MVQPRQSGRVDQARVRLGGLPDQGMVSVTTSLREATQGQDQVHLELARDKVLSEAAYQDLVSRGLVTAFERTNFIQMVQAQTPPVAVVSFTVPGEFLFRLDKVGFWFSDPILHQLNSQTYLPWSVEVENTPIPGFGENNSLSYRVPIGSPFNPWTFEPVWCHANQTVTVLLRTFAAVTIQVNVSARIGGGLIKKSSLRLGRQV